MSIWWSDSGELLAFKLAGRLVRVVFEARGRAGRSFDFRDVTEILRGNHAQVYLSPGLPSNGEETYNYRIFDATLPPHFLHAWVTALRRALELVDDIDGHC